MKTKHEAVDAPPPDGAAPAAAATPVRALKPAAEPAPTPAKTPVGNKLLFGLSFAGFLAGLLAAHLFGLKKAPLPPAFKPAENPYPNGIYSEGIVESDQASGSNISIFPEVTGVVVKVLAAEGSKVKKGEPLVLLDDSVPRAQAESARASLKGAEDSLAKLEAAYALDPGSITRESLDTARSAAAAARANLAAANALLSKYVLRATTDGVVMTMSASLTSYLSPQGVYDPYTQGYDPVITLGTGAGELHVRCFVDEILVTRMPSPKTIKAQMALRGSDVRIPLEFVRMQPFVSPKIELSDQKEERVDVRVLPVIFRFARPEGLNIYPGELVDVYIGE
jgi:HlyD family secretion protein